MNAWDIDPNLYATLWRLLREAYRRRTQAQVLARAAQKRHPHAGCRA